VRLILRFKVEASPGACLSPLWRRDELSTLNSGLALQPLPISERLEIQIQFCFMPLVLLASLKQNNGK